MTELLAVSVTANLFLIFSYMKMRFHCQVVSELLKGIACGEVELVADKQGSFEVRVNKT
jgi:hypothetical protein